MKLLINEKEIANFILKKLDYKQVYDIEYLTEETQSTVRWIILEKSKPKFKLEKFKYKFQRKLTKAVEKDLSEWVQKVKSLLDNLKKHRKKIILANLEKIIKVIGEEKLLSAYRFSSYSDFVKSIGLSIYPDAHLVRRNTFTGFNEPCVVRNTIGNEQLLKTKIDNNLEFWFIDSGYTNFAETHKKWHRISRNHIHSYIPFDAPADRLKMFTKFPAPWRQGGEIILVLEPGHFAANIFNVEIDDWKRKIAEQLKMYTDKKILFREKFNKKQRPSLIKFLEQEDIYCTISINSNGATESIWAGVPAITLDKHITNPVTRNRLDQINDLYRGPIGNWLCWLSYSQFTYEEILSGKAVSIIRKYYD